MRLRSIGSEGRGARILQELKQRAAREYIDPGIIALLYIDLGQKDQAFEWLEKAYVERTQWMVWLKVEPKFESVRSDPRFTNLVRRVGFTPQPQ